LLGKQRKPENFSPAVLFSLRKEIDYVMHMLRIGFVFIQVDSEGFICAVGL